MEGDSTCVEKEKEKEGGFLVNWFIDFCTRENTMAMAIKRMPWISKSSVTEI